MQQCTDSSLKVPCMICMSKLSKPSSPVVLWRKTWMQGSPIWWPCGNPVQNAGQFNEVWGDPNRIKQVQSVFNQWINEPDCQWHLQQLRFGDVLNLQCGRHPSTISARRQSSLSTCQHTPAKKHSRFSAHQWQIGLNLPILYDALLKQIQETGSMQVMKLHELPMISGGRRSSEGISNCLETWHSGCCHCRC